jgi:hypothetical protein
LDLQEPASFHPPGRLEYAKRGAMTRMMNACARAKHDRHQRLPHRQVRYKSKVDIRVRAQEIPRSSSGSTSSHPARAHALDRRHGVFHVLPSVSPGRSFMTLHSFNIGHPEKLPSTQTRYRNETKRVARVLDRVLDNRTWLVGEKCMYADLAVVTWNRSIDYALKGGPMV